MRLFFLLALAALLLIAASLALYPSAGFDGRSLLAAVLAVLVLAKLRGAAA
ncbi:hypothetical protein ACIPY3_02475 [Paenarthrobacter sp. NPDC089714]|uniref:hypothetical protein n=1 Tax=Paenarthrobacter sp. NPDC089714 TaxID=3364377 RepID=UPI00382D6A7E